LFPLGIEPVIPRAYPWKKLVYFEGRKIVEIDE
jgi:hypothetical protein